MTTFHRIDPAWIELTAVEGFRIDPEGLDECIGRESIDALLISNPCNPTGMVIQVDELIAECLDRIDSVLNRKERDQPKE